MQLVIPIQCPLSKPPLFTLFGQLPTLFEKIKKDPTYEEQF